MQSTIFRSTHCVRDIATSELPRDRLLSRGASALSNTELLAVLFGCDPERIRADVCAAGGLAGYMIRHDAALPLARQARVRAALELARRVMGEELAAGAGLTSPRDSAAYLKARLAHLPYEVFACLFLDNRHRVLAFEEMFRGTLDGASVHPREVVRAALEHNAAAVILAHNHPSGVAEPSAADRNITRQLRDALQLVGVRVLDHLVVGSGEPTSMAARGLIQPAPTGAPIVRRPAIALQRLCRKTIGPEASTLDKLVELVGESTRRANAALDHVLAAMKRLSPKWPTSTP